MRISFSSFQLENSKFQHHIEIYFFVNKIHALVKINMQVFPEGGKRYRMDSKQAGQTVIKKIGALNFGYGPCSFAAKIKVPGSEEVRYARSVLIP
jgi:hypothetical protein